MEIKFLISLGFSLLSIAVSVPFMIATFRKMRAIRRIGAESERARELALPVVVHYVDTLGTSDRKEVTEDLFKLLKLYVQSKHSVEYITTALKANVYLHDVNEPSPSLEDLKIMAALNSGYKEDEEWVDFRQQYTYETLALEITNNLVIDIWEENGIPLPETSISRIKMPY